MIDPVDPLDMARLAQALNDPDPKRTLNLLGPGPAASREVLAAVLGPPDIDTLATDATQLTGVVSGRLFETPAGKVEMILGTEWRKEAVQFDSLFGAFEREVAGGFAELEVPLLGESMHLPAARELTLTLAGRFDRYTDFGEIFSPQYGLVWRPFRDVAVRATYGRSFRAPSLYELYLPDVSAHDASRGSAAQWRVLQRAAAGWRDARARSHSRRIFRSGHRVHSRSCIQPLKLSATYWHVMMDDRVTALNPVFAVTHESLFADRVLRAEPTAEDLAAGRPGECVQIDSSRMNFGRLDDERHRRRRELRIRRRCRSLYSGCEGHLDRRVRVARLAGRAGGGSRQRRQFARHDREVARDHESRLAARSARRDCVRALHPELRRHARRRAQRPDDPVADLPRPAVRRWTSASSWTTHGCCAASSSRPAL